MNPHFLNKKYLPQVFRLFILTSYIQILNSVGIKFGDFAVLGQYRVIKYQAEKLKPWNS